MCNFLSAIALRNGDVLHYWALDSHTMLLEHFGISDTDNLENFARIEFLPENWFDPETWKLEIDERIKPQWFSDIEENIRAKLVALVKRQIITTGIKRHLHDGWWIVGGGAEINYVGGGCKLLQVKDNAKVIDVCENAKVIDVSGNAKVIDVSGNAQVTGVFGNAQVTGVFGRAQMANVCENAKVTNVCENAKVTNVFGNAQVTGVYENAKVTNVSGSAQVTK